MSSGALYPCPFCAVPTEPHGGSSDKVNDGKLYYAESERDYRCAAGHEFTVSTMITGVAQPEREDVAR